MSFDLSNDDMAIEFWWRQTQQTYTYGNVVEDPYPITSVIVISEA